MPNAVKNPSPVRLLASAETKILAADLGAAKAQVMLAMVVAESMGDRHDVARAATLLTRVLLILNEADQAMAMAMRAVEWCRAVGDKGTEAKAHALAARALLSVGETDAAPEACRAALDASTACTELEATIAATRELANVYSQLQQWDKALEFGERLCEAAKLNGNGIGASGGELHRGSHLSGQSGGVFVGHRPQRRGP
jgi:tetratricopeptide (TPR) repeat protein